MNFTGAPVSRPLGSVKKMCRAGHAVLFDDDGSFIFNKVTREDNMMREEDGNYLLDVYVPPHAGCILGIQSSSPFHRQLP